MKDARSVESIGIRELRPDDDGDRAPALARLHADAHAAGMALGLLAGAPSELERFYRDTIAHVGDDHPLLVAELDGDTVGMAQLVRAAAANARHRAEVRGVAVAARMRGCGVGARLMSAVEHSARARGITLLWLTTHAGTAACAFYEALGYTRLGVMPKYSARPDGSLADGAFFYREPA